MWSKSDKYKANMFQKLFKITSNDIYIVTL